MRNSRGDLRGIPSQGKVDARPASARSRRTTAPGAVFGPKSRPFRRRVVAVCQALPWRDLTPNRRAHYIAAVVLCPYGLSQPTIPGGELVPVGDGSGGQVEIAETLISTKLAEVIST